MNNIPRTNHFIWLRYLAAFSIVFSHSKQFDTAPQSYIDVVATLTWFVPGVPILFFISGFLITLSSSNSDSLTAFFVKRVLRVYPPLWAAFSVSLVLIFTLGMVDLHGQDWLKFLLWSLGQLTVVFFYHPDFLSHVGTGVLNGSLWVIPVILQFYLGLPLLKRLDAYWVQRGKTQYIYVVLILCGLFNMVFHYFNNFYPNNVTKVIHFLTFLPWLFFFILGYVFSRDFVRFRRLTQYATPWILLHVMLFISLAWLGFRWGRNDINPILFTVLAFFIVSIAFKAPSTSTLFNKIEKAIAKNDVSFGLFVYQMVVLNTMMFLGVFEDNWAARLVTFLIATIMISSASLILLEKPLRHRRDWFIKVLSSRNKLSKGVESK
ncbi:acyltransferase family protein [Alteromonas lipotrueae]|uniref:acyltransferase family protein n=1 Tax=Alteromonas lipotrueae TaxID=2803814 RepID=UPI001C45158E|nr:acyltransferase [Alteromonas lipotrueae]